MTWTGTNRLNKCSLPNTSHRVSGILVFVIVCVCYFVDKSIWVHLTLFGFFSLQRFIIRISYTIHWQRLNVGPLKTIVINLLNYTVFIKNHNFSCIVSKSDLLRLQLFSFGFVLFLLSILFVTVKPNLRVHNHIWVQTKESIRTPVYLRICSYTYPIIDMYIVDKNTGFSRIFIVVRSSLLV